MEQFFSEELLVNLQSLFNSVKAKLTVLKQVTQERRMLVSRLFILLNEKLEGLPFLGYETEGDVYEIYHNALDSELDKIKANNDMLFDTLDELREIVVKFFAADILPSVCTNEDLKSVVLETNFLVWSYSNAQDIFIAFGGEMGFHERFMKEFVLLDMVEMYIDNLVSGEMAIVQELHDQIHFLLQTIWIYAFTDLSYHIYQQ